jgi:hypothetical protein
MLSFAQFEREVIGERVLDKIAASKRKGLWVGGPIPLGYATVNKKLVIVPEDAETIRTMFQLYLQCGSVGALAAKGHHPRKRCWPGTTSGWISAQSTITRCLGRHAGAQVAVLMVHLILKPRYRRNAGPLRRGFLPRCCVLQPQAMTRVLTYRP